MNQEAWWPKSNRPRQVPFTKAQGEILGRWIERRPKELEHPYLLWTMGKQSRTKFCSVKSRTFQRWTMLTHPKLKPHVLRYSFATHYYNQSKDIKLISLLLGHANVATTSEYLAFSHEDTMKKGRALFHNGGLKISRYQFSSFFSFYHIILVLSIQYFLYDDIQDNQYIPKTS